MITRKTIVDQIEITRDNTVQVRLAKILEEDGREINSAWHRTAIGPGIAARDQMEEVNRHLVEMGEAEVSQADIDKVAAFVALARQE